MSAGAHSELHPAALASGRLGLYGGSFDPPHAGHLYVADQAARAFGLDHVVFAPAARPPHKPDRQLASGQDRCALLALLLEGRSDRSVWSLELERSGPSYTIDSVRALREQVAEEAQLFLLLGADNLSGLAGWKDVEELLELVQPIVCVRSDSTLDPPGLRALSPRGREKLDRGRLVVEPFDVSSSELRAALAAGRDPGPGLPPKLAEYLRAHDIYR